MLVSIEQTDIDVESLGGSVTDQGTLLVDLPEGADTEDQPIEVRVLKRSAEDVDEPVNLGGDDALTQGGCGRS